MHNWRPSSQKTCSHIQAAIGRHPIDRAEREVPRMLRTISILFWLACLTPRPFAAEPKLVSVKKIWDKAPHCAFTDLARFQKRWLCTFREAKGHDSVNGTVRVIESVDGMSWKSAASLSEAGIDLRDPKLSQMPDGRLMLLMGGIVNRDGKYLTRAPRVSFSHDGYDWSRPKKVLSEDHWLWRVTWHKGKGWCLSKLNEGRKPRRGFLYWTKDGIDWNYVTEFEIDGVSETTTAIPAGRDDGRPGSPEVHRHQQAPLPEVDFPHDETRHRRAQLHPSARRQPSGRADASTTSSPGPRCHA